MFIISNKRLQNPNFIMVIMKTISEILFKRKVYHYNNNFFLWFSSNGQTPSLDKSITFFFC